MTIEEQTISGILSLDDHQSKLDLVKLYARDKAIQFSKWLHNNHYIRHGGDFFQKLNSDIKKDPLYTHDQLYSRFLDFLKTS